MTEGGIGAALGIAGVATMLLTGAESVRPAGVAASVAAMLTSSLGYVLAKKWGGGVPVLASTAWFTGLRHLTTGTVGLIGLLNPVTGVVLGIALAGETVGGRQAIGIALVLVGILLGQPAAARWLHRRHGRRRGPYPVPTHAHG